MLNLHPELEQNLDVLSAALRYAYSNWDDIADALDLDIDAQHAEQLITGLLAQIQDLRMSKR